ncbi:MAG: hypothetical protein GX145_05050 [Clostridiaceae bacterium]|jgi:SOS response regulatory protein OraA/RecX|nr:RecX family transcriptional regulator [Bacillota bacterium]NLN52157.1 hypothetical protein [Clostridiaceae bacterium]
MNQEKSYAERLSKAQELVSQLHKSFPEQGKTNQASDVSTKHQEAYSKLRTRALKYIGIDRGRSFGQVKRILMRDLPEISEANSQLVDMVIQDLINDQYLDEYLCGRRIIKRHSGRAQKSKEYIRQLMYKQGISPAVIKDTVLEIDDDYQTAERYRLVKQAEWDISNPGRVMRHLAARGYSAGISRKIVQKWLDDVATK